MAKRLTKIVATVGPACQSRDMIVKLIRAGVNVFRLNFSHGSPDQLTPVIQAIREESEQMKLYVGILCDLQGPKFRTGVIKPKDDGKKDPIELRKGAEVRLVTSGTVPFCDETVIAMGTAHADVCVRELEVGQRVLLEDGHMKLEVLRRVSENEIVCKVITPGKLGEKKGVNVPDLRVGVPALTEKDRSDAIFALKQQVDFLALSFVQRPDDVLDLRKLCEEQVSDPALRPLIISKIEKPHALTDIDAILGVSDGIMVARGDLGVEYSLERVPSAQKMLIMKANAAGRMVITATEMLQSMIENAVPTRAEVSDVENAVYDGTDAVMLSGETSIGKYPEEAVTMMANCCVEAEASARMWERPVPRQALMPRLMDTPRRERPALQRRMTVVRFVETHEVEDPDRLAFADSVSRAAVSMARDVKAAGIIVVSKSGATAQMLCKQRPDRIVVAVTRNARVARSLTLLYAVKLIVMQGDSASHSDELLKEVDAAVSEAGLLAVGDLTVVAAGASGFASLANSLRLHVLGDGGKGGKGGAGAAAAAAADEESKLERVD